MGYTLVLLKPSVLQRGLCGRIISRYEDAGLTLIRLELKHYDKQIFADLYKEHQGKPYYERIIANISAASIVAMVLGGPESIVEKVRILNGATDPIQAAPGTIRGDFAANLKPDNIVHASDSSESAQREIRLFFPDLTQE